MGLCYIEITGGAESKESLIRKQDPAKFTSLVHTISVQQENNRAEQGRNSLKMPLLECQHGKYKTQCFLFHNSDVKWSAGYPKKLYSADSVVLIYLHTALIKPGVYVGL